MTATPFFFILFDMLTRTFLKNPSGCVELEVGRSQNQCLPVGKQSAVCTSVVSVIHCSPYRQNGNPLRCVLDIPDFPKTSEDAEDLMIIARSSREECNSRKDAAAHAVTKHATTFKVLQRESPSFGSSPAAEDLQTLREELSEWEGRLSAAEYDIGTVRSILSKKGLPIPLYTTPHAPDGQLSAGGNAAVFDDESDVSSGDVNSSFEGASG